MHVLIRLLLLPKSEEQADQGLNCLLLLLHHLEVSNLDRTSKFEFQVFTVKLMDV